MTLSMPFAFVPLRVRRRVVDAGREAADRLSSPRRIASKVTRYGQPTKGQYL